MRRDSKKSLVRLSLAVLLTALSARAAVAQGYREYDAATESRRELPPPSHANYDLDLAAFAESATQGNGSFESSGAVAPASNAEFTTGPRAPAELGGDFRDATPIREADPLTGSPQPAEVLRDERVLPAAAHFPLSAPNRAKQSLAQQSVEAPLARGGPELKPFVYQQPPPPEPLQLGAMVSRLVIGTVTVLGACVVCLMLGKQWLPTAVGGSKSTGSMRVVATLGLPHKSYLQLVEVDDRKLIVAGNMSGVQAVVPLGESFQDDWHPEPVQGELQDEPNQGEGRLAPSDANDAVLATAARKFLHGM